MELTQKQKKFLDRLIIDGRWSLTSEGKIDVKGWVSIPDGKLTKLPVKFRRVDGGFNCSRNKLTSLEGCPDWVGRSFNCSENNLTSLEGCPDYVGTGFYCNYNNLKVYFKNIKEEDFKHWDKLDWGDVIKEYPFLINITKNYVDKEDFIELIKDYPKTKLYLR
jgi:hypothetical protein